jgi:hypothetical protein
MRLSSLSTPRRRSSKTSMMGPKSHELYAHGCVGQAARVGRLGLILELPGII